MSKPNILVINSKDRIQSSSISTTNFVYELPCELDNVCSICLDFACIPNVIYNINSSNNTITTNLGSGQILPLGIYNETELATAIANVLTTIGHGGVSVSWNSFSNRFSFTTASPWTLSLTQQLADILGCETSTPFALTFISGRPSRMDYNTREIYIQILEQFPANLSSNNLKANFLVPNINVDKWKNITYKSQSDYFVQSFPIGGDIRRRLRIKLVDISGQDISLEGSDWFMVLGVQYSNKEKYSSF